MLLAVYQLGLGLGQQRREAIKQTTIKSQHHVLLPLCGPRGVSWTLQIGEIGVERTFARLISNMYYKFV